MKKILKRLQNFCDDFRDVIIVFTIICSLIIGVVLLVCYEENHVYFKYDEYHLEKQTCTVNTYIRYKGTLIEHYETKNVDVCDRKETVRKLRKNYRLRLKEYKQMCK